MLYCRSWYVFEKGLLVKMLFCDGVGLGYSAVVIQFAVVCLLTEGGSATYETSASKTGVTKHETVSFTSTSTTRSDLQTLSPITGLSKVSLWNSYSFNLFRHWYMCTSVTKFTKEDRY